MRPIRRRFPDYGWAWPTGDLDRLLKAVLHPDDETALNAALTWLNTNDIETVGFRDHRLLVAVAQRFGRRLSDHPTYPRLSGLQKMLWSRARFAYRAAKPALLALAEAGSPPMLIKGASRIALDPTAQRERVAHDLDILVRPEHMTFACEALLQLRWQPSTGMSAKRVSSLIHTVRAMNFFKDEFGDIDLHQRAYAPTQECADDDSLLWKRGHAAALDEAPVLVPCAADRVTIAIAHGGLDSHAHSDWVVDIAATVNRDKVDWDTLLETVRRRRIVVPAAVALSYLEHELRIAVPRAVVDELVLCGRRLGLPRFAALLEAKPRTDFGWFSGPARGLAKQIRLRRSRDAIRPVGAARENVWRAKARRPQPAMGPDSFKSRHTIALPPETERREVGMDIEVRMRLPPVRRRVELELSTRSRHVAHLRYRKIGSARRELNLCFSGSLCLEDRDDVLFLEARPSRHPRQWGEDGATRYGAIPFALVNWDLRPK